MGDLDIEGNKKTFGESTKITLSIKTLAIVIGILLSAITTLATIGYFDVKSDQAELKKDYETAKSAYKEEIKAVLQEELRDLREKDVRFVEDIGEIKGDIKVILDRTMRNNDHNDHNMHSVTTPVVTTMPTTIPVVENREDL